jgi:hypothetical protein
MLPIHQEGQRVFARAASKSEVAAARSLFYFPVNIDSISYENGYL